MRRARASLCAIRRLRRSSTPGNHFTRAGKLSVLLDEQTCHRLASACGLRIALGCYDDRALNEDVPGARKGLCIAQPGFLGEATHDHADLLEMPNAGAACGMLRAE